MLLKILWIIEHLFQKSKCFFFHNISKYMTLQRHQKALLWGKGLCFSETNNKCADQQAGMHLCCWHATSQIFLQGGPNIIAHCFTNRFVLFLNDGA